MWIFHFHHNFWISCIFSHKISCNISSSISHSISRSISNKISCSILDKISCKISYSISHKISTESPAKFPTESPAKISHRISCKISHIISYKISHNFPQYFPQHFHQSLPILLTNILINPLQLPSFKKRTFNPQHWTLLTPKPLKTSMHSSRMHTACTLIVFPSSLPPGGLPKYILGVCLNVYLGGLSKYRGGGSA